MTLPLRSTVDATLAREVIDGLAGRPKTLPAKFFYDETGAALFEQICALDEYYLTRSELEILRAHTADIARLAGPRCALIEYGSGAGVKIRLLLDALESPASYVPVDISGEQLVRVAGELAGDYPSLSIKPVCADYNRPFTVPDLPQRARRIAFFPGSTIGNFHPPEAAAFLRRVRQVIGPGGGLVLGVDRRKDEQILNAAYNDAAGVTAAFNLNMLRRINRDTGADFNVDRFRHRAFFNDRASRVEMHLESVVRQVVTIGDARVAFEAGETIWTESSYKYTAEQLEALAATGGFRIDQSWTDANERFWVVFLTRVDD